MLLTYLVLKFSKFRFVKKTKIAINLKRFANLRIDIMFILERIFIMSKASVIAEVLVIKDIDIM
jgi:hypothetical protein